MINIKVLTVTLNKFTLINNNKTILKKKEIDISDTEITSNGLIDYINSENSNDLKKIVSYGNFKIDSSFLVVLAESNCRLVHLDLRSCYITDAGLGKFLDSEAAEQLKYIDISHNFETITDQTMLHIKNSAHCQRL